MKNAVFSLQTSPFYSHWPSWLQQHEQQTEIDLKEKQRKKTAWRPAALHIGRQNMYEEEFLILLLPRKRSGEQSAHFELQ